MLEQYSLVWKAVLGKRQKARWLLLCALMCMAAILLCLGGCSDDQKKDKQASAKQSAASTAPAAAAKALPATKSPDRNSANKAAKEALGTDLMQSAQPSGNAPTQDAAKAWPFSGNAANAAAEWTVMVYMCGDNNLEYQALLDVLEMEQALPEGTEVIVLLDRHAGYTNMLGNWKDARMYRIRKAPHMDLFRANIGYADAQLPEQLSSELLEQWGEVDMSDPAVLTRFIQTAAKRFPAKRYALIPWDHGGGWTGLLQDEDGGSGMPGKGMMSIEQFAEAVRKGAKALPRGKFDLLKYELCLMAQLDVLANSANLADYVVACAPVEPGQGSDYLSVLPQFRAGVSTKDLVVHTVNTNTKFFTKLGIAASFSGFDMAKLEPVLAAHRSLMQALEKLAPTRFKELTRVTHYTMRHESTEDLKRGRGAFSSLELFDWLNRLEADVPGAPAKEIRQMRDALKPFMIATANTPNMKKCGGITTYLPLRRTDANPNFAASPFAQASGKLKYVNALFMSQETLGSAKPAVRNIVLGRPQLREGRDGRLAEDFNIIPLQGIRPFAHSVIRFEVVGSNILWTKMSQYQRRGNEAVLHFTDLVVDMTAARKRADKAGSLLEALSPAYNDGATMLMREITGNRFKVTNGQAIADVTVDNSDISASMNKATVLGMYTDQTLGGKELLVQLEFNTDFMMVQSVTAIEQDAQGRVYARAIQPRQDGFFRPGQLIVGNQGERWEFGQPMAWGQGLILTLGLVEEGAEIGKIIEVETVNGQTAFAMSNTLPVYHDQAQKRLLENTRSQGMQNIDGRYAMVQYATTKDGVDLLPTFNTLSLSSQGPQWELEGKGSGIFTWNSFATPMLVLLEKPQQQWLPPKVVASWYTFLDGSGPARSWYLISIGDGTRWGLFPIEYYQNALEGTWVSKTERWVFKGGTVTLTRDRQTGSGTIQVNGNRISATGMPFKEYAFHVNRSKGKLVLMSKEGVASFLTREGSAPQPAAAPAVNPAKTAASLVGEWRAQEGSEYSSASIRAVPNTAWFTMRLVNREGWEMASTFGVKGDRLLLTLRNGSHLDLHFTLTATTLSLTFPDGRTAAFSRAR